MTTLSWSSWPNFCGHFAWLFLVVVSLFVNFPCLVMIFNLFVVVFCLFGFSLCAYFWSFSNYLWSFCVSFWLSFVSFFGNFSLLVMFFYLFMVILCVYLLVFCHFDITLSVFVVMNSLAPGPGLVGPLLFHPWWSLIVTQSVFLDRSDLNHLYVGLDVWPFWDHPT